MSDYILMKIWGTAWILNVGYGSYFPVDPGLAVFL